MNQIGNEIKNFATYNEILSQITMPLMLQVFRRVRHGDLSEIKLGMDDSVFEEFQENEINSSKV